MGRYSIAEARDILPNLVRQAEAGEDLAITQHGKIVAYLRAAPEAASRRPSWELIETLAARP